MKHFSSLLSAVALVFCAMPAWALTVDNITYSLSESFVSSTATTETWALTLDILNNSNDGRTGVTSLAFNRPDGFVAASLPGWTTVAGGLNASGCNGNGNFFCFSGYAEAAATMSFTFMLTGGVDAFEAFSPDFKIEWVGSQNNYDLVSQNLPVIAVPEAGSSMLMLLGLGAIGAMMRRRRSV